MASGHLVPRVLVILRWRKESNWSMEYKVRSAGFEACLGSSTRMALTLQQQWHGMGGGLRLSGGSSKVEEPWVGRRRGGRQRLSGHLGEARAATTTAASHTRAPALRPSAFHKPITYQLHSHPSKASPGQLFAERDLGRSQLEIKRPLTQLGN